MARSPVGIIEGAEERVELFQVGSLVHVNVAYSLPQLHLQNNQNFLLKSGFYSCILLIQLNVTLFQD